MKRYAYAWLTAGFFLISLALHWWFGWTSFVDEQQAHGEAVDVAAYLSEMGRDTFENWQSEFLQLLWQVVGLAYFLYVGSPASKETDDGTEAKLDAILRLVGKEKGEQLINELDERYLRHQGHAQPHGHDQAYPRGKGDGN